VLVEAPGSQSFEMSDIPAIATVAHAKGAPIIDDNTWATPLFHARLTKTSISAWRPPPNISVTIPQGRYRARLCGPESRQLERFPAKAFPRT
jgi:hypothetical protein